MKNILNAIAALLLFVPVAQSQAIKFSSDPLNNPWQGNFLTKRNNVLITINFPFLPGIRGTNDLYFYDSAMDLTKKVTIALPKEAYSPVTCVYNDFFYILYQVQDENAVYLDAAKIDFDGKIVESYHLDTTKIRFLRHNFYDYIYSVITSEDKHRLMAFKIDNREGLNTTVTTLLFNDSLTLLHRSVLYTPLVDGVDFLTNFTVDNDGDLVFFRNHEVNDMEQAANKTLMIIKNALSDSVYFFKVVAPGTRLADIHIKIDNLHKKFIVASFYSSSKRRNIDGLYCFLWNKVDRRIIAAREISLGDSLRRLAEQPGNLKQAFNNFTVQNILLRNDGGFLIDAGSFESTKPLKTDTWNQLFNLTEKTPAGYISYTGLKFPWNAFALTENDFRGGNTAVFSFDSTALPDWIKFLNMPQFSDYYRGIGYTPFVVNDKVYYIYNHTEKRTAVPALQVIDADGNAYEKMIKDAEKVTGAKIVPAPMSFVQISSHQGLVYLASGRIQANEFAVVTF
ncbi:MAG TPA: hypothetical protein VG738_08105 [Chitinophagaceae bacterium]|nr:hypothetical protein [Chitinophagaceae bacterium]